MAAEMHDALHAGDGFLHLREIGEVGGDEIVARREIGGFADIARPKVWVDAAQDFTQPRADIAGSTGDDNLLHRLLQSIQASVRSPFASLHFCSCRSMLPPAARWVSYLSEMPENTDVTER